MDFIRSDLFCSTAKNAVTPVPATHIGPGLNPNTQLSKFLFGKRA